MPMLLTRPIKQNDAGETVGATEPVSARRPEPSPPRTVWLLALSVGTFVLGVDGFVLSGLLPQAAFALHVSVGTAGQLTTLFALVYAIGSPVLGAATGSWERRTVLRAGMGLFVAGVSVQAIGPTFPVVATGRVLAALGAAAYQANAYSTAALLSDDRRRARSLAVVAGGSSVALVAGLPFGVLVGQAFGWRAALWLIVGLAAFSGLTVGLLPRVHAPQTRLRDRIGVLGDGRVVNLLLTTLTVLIPSFLIISYLPAVLGSAGALVVLAMVALGGGQVLATTLVANLIDRRGARTALVMGACAITISVAALSVLRLTPVGALVCLVVLGLGAGSVVVPQQHRVFNLVPSQAPVAMGLNGSAIYLASASAAAIGGVVLTLSEVTALTLTAGAVGVLGLSLATFVRPERKKGS